MRAADCRKQGWLFMLWVEIYYIGMVGRTVRGLGADLDKTRPVRFAPFRFCPYASVSILSHYQTPRDLVVRLGKYH